MSTNQFQQIFNVMIVIVAMILMVSLIKSLVGGITRPRTYTRTRLTGSDILRRLIKW